MELPDVPRVVGALGKGVSLHTGTTLKGKNTSGKAFEF